MKTARLKLTPERLLFTFQIPSLLPPTSETVFDRTSHTLVASVLESAPEYALGPVPEYDEVVPCFSPRGSISSLSDWSFAAPSSRRSSLFSDASESRRGSITSRRSSVSSVSGESDNGSRRGSVVSRRGSTDSEIAEVAEPKKKRGLFGGFRRKSSTPSSSPDTRRAESHSPMRPAPVTTVTQAEPECDGIRLAEWLLPSTAARTAPLEIVSCPAPKGEICTVDWTKNSDTVGLGRSQKYVHSNIVSTTSLSHPITEADMPQFSLGSGVNFEYKLNDIPSNTTVHNIRLSLCQKTKAGNGDTEEEIFTLFSRGNEQVSNGRVKIEDLVWRGEVPRTWDAQPAKMTKSGKSTPKSAIPQVALPGVIAGPSSLRIRSKVRLPTPMAGAVPSSPKLLDNRLARTVHRLRIETFFSVLGEDESGRPLLPDPKAKNGKPREGTLRRTWVDHDVTIGSCCITPENVLVPTYTSSPDHILGEAQQKAKIQARTALPKFEMQRTCTHTVKTVSATCSTERSEGLPHDAPARLQRHSCETDSRCLCFHGDSVVAGMIGSLGKPGIEEEIVPLLVEIGGMVKSLYEPATHQVAVTDLVLPTPRTMPAPQNQAAHLVACL